MRAKMSEPDNRRQVCQIVYTTSGGTRYLTDSAMAEARAILAETEPNGSRSTSMPISVLRHEDPDHFFFGHALAESLAAFVGAF